MRIRQKIKSFLSKKHKIRQSAEDKARPHQTYYNPCSPEFRSIIEQILHGCSRAYKELELVIIDTEEQDSIWAEEEAYMIKELLEGLNKLCIYTKRSVYFEEKAEQLLEETGLVAEIRTKGTALRTGNLVLDFERSGGLSNQFIGSGSIYIPIYKKTWEISQNLDIKVPIGYNTVIVKGTKNRNTETFYDKLEREFYAE